MSEECPTCEEEAAAGPAHGLLTPERNTNLGSAAPTPLAACSEEQAAALAECHDGYRIPLVVELASASATCATFDLRSPCAERWAYPGLLVEIYPLGFAEVTEVSGDWLTLKNLTIAPDANIGVGLTIRPVPRAPDSLNAWSVAADDVDDPATAEGGALSQNIVFPVGASVQACGASSEETRWKLRFRRGMCGLPLTTAAGVSPLLVPLWNPTTGCFHFLPNGAEGTPFVIKGGVPAWYSEPVAKYVFIYTGAAQFLEVPVGFTQAQFKQWGAGGSDDGGVNGGVGGFTRATVPVTAADVLQIIVGEGVHNKLGRTFGFGGAGQGGAHQHNGGGLSGVFTGADPLTAADFARALTIAGGGGAGGQSGGNANATIGWGGNDASVSTMSDMQGNDSTGGVSSGGGGGGGGYRGGVAAGLGGHGGSGFIVGTATESEMLTGERNAADPPMVTDPDYVSGVGRKGQPGLVVINFLP